MAINLEDKKAIVAEVNEAAKVALSAVVVDARGVTVGAMTGLRKEAREAGVYVRVVRNTLLKRAVADTPYSVLNDVFTGPTLIAFSNEHPGAAARLFKEFAKGQDKFEIKAASFEGKFLAANEIDVLPLQVKHFTATHRSLDRENDQRLLRALQQLAGIAGAHLVGIGLALLVVAVFGAAHGTDDLLGGNAIGRFGILAHKVLSAAGHDVGLVTIGSEIFQQLLHG